MGFEFSFKNFGKKIATGALIATAATSSSAHESVNPKNSSDSISIEKSVNPIEDNFTKEIHALHERSKEVFDYYKNNPNYIMEASAPGKSTSAVGVHNFNEIARTSFDNLNKNGEVSYIKNGEFYTGTVNPSEFYINIDGIRYFQRDQDNDVLNFDAPRQLFNKEITPDSFVMFTGKAGTIYAEDVVKVYMYEDNSNHSTKTTVANWPTKDEVKLVNKSKDIEVNEKISSEKIVQDKIVNTKIPEPVRDQVVYPKKAENSLGFVEKKYMRYFDDGRQPEYWYYIKKPNGEHVSMSESDYNNQMNGSVDQVAKIKND